MHILESFLSNSDVQLCLGITGLDEVKDGMGMGEFWDILGRENGMQKSSIICHLMISSRSLGISYSLQENLFCILILQLILFGLLGNHCYLLFFSVGWRCIRFSLMEMTIFKHSRRHNIDLVVKHLEASVYVCFCASCLAPSTPWSLLVEIAFTVCADT